MHYECDIVLRNTPNKYKERPSQETNMNVVVKIELDLSFEANDTFDNWVVIAWLLADMDVSIDHYILFNTLCIAVRN